MPRIAAFSGSFRNLDPSCDLLGQAGGQRRARPFQLFHRAWLRQRKTLCFKPHKHPAKEKLLGSTRLRLAGLQPAQGRWIPMPGLVPRMGCAGGREAGSPSRSSSLDASISVEKEALTIPALEIQPGIRKREDFPNRCANRGVRYGRVQLNAMKQIGLGRICRGPVWKSGLFRFLAAVSQPYAVLQHAVASCVHVGVLGLKGSVSSRELLGWAQGRWCGVATVRGGHGRVVRAVRRRGRTRLDKHQQPSIFLVLRVRTKSLSP